MASTPEKVRAPDFWLFVCFCILFCWAPIPLGSNRTWASGVLELGNGLIALGLLRQWYQGKIEVSTALHKARWAALLFLLIPLWTLLQIIPLPEPLLALLSPKAAALYGPGAHPLSLDANASLYSLQKSISYALTFLLALQLLNDKNRIQNFLKVLVFVGVAEALYGGILLYGGSTLDIFDLYDLSEHLREHSAVGSFVNRNHLAGYLEMSLAIGIGLLIATLERNESEITWRERARRLLRMMLGGKAMLRLYLAIMVIGLVLTHSRMGNTAFFASLGIAGGIGLLIFRKSSRSVVILFASLIIIDMFIVGAWFGVQKVAERLENTQLQYEGRTFVNQQAPVMMKDFPVTGTGAGSFYSSFPSYRSGDIWGFYDFAHNDYYQTLIEYGLIGGLLFAGIAVLCLYTAVQAQRERRTQLLQGAGFAAMMGILALLIHSWTDFNLHIPSNAALFSCLCALAFAARYAGTSGKQRRSR